MQINHAIAEGEAGCLLHTLQKDLQDCRSLSTADHVSDRNCICAVVSHYNALQGIAEVVDATWKKHTGGCGKALMSTQK